MRVPLYALSFLLHDISRYIECSDGMMLCIHVVCTVVPNSLLAMESNKQSRKIISMHRVNRSAPIVPASMCNNKTQSLIQSYHDQRQVYVIVVPNYTLYRREQRSDT